MLEAPSAKAGAAARLYTPGVILKKLDSLFAGFQSNIGEMILASGYHLPYLCSVLVVAINNDISGDFVEILAMLF
ncbi:hypothetical protein [Ralstonia syzygii]|uniref:Uncharacterized protein n=1 Tax=Ralstonia syzygii R24 TaxID=907261 RepID=G3AA10_9RALS|nr:hypothetical protein [Ralstonia syzygii]CCA88144.1 hypothetical protein RALSY_mp10685 [Ralstonia syzygii R24]